jgi:tetratricopeptide (TPR) repeat protein
LVAIDNEHLDPAGERRCNDARADRDYAAAFQEAGFAERHDAPQNEAARVASSVVRTALLAGLDDWAACTADKNRRNWLLTIARLADANAARDPAAGNNPSSVADMTKSIIVTSQSVPTLIMVGERLRATGGDAISFLSEVQKAHPDDFRANVTLGNFLSEPEPDMAARYYRQALAIRPQSAMAYNNLGHISYNAHQWEQAIVDYQRALQVDASFGPAYNNLGLVLKKQGKWDQATERFREAVRLDPQSATCHVNLADIQAASGKLNDAIDHYQIAIRLDPGFAQAHYMLGLALPPGARLDHAILVHDQALRESPENLRAHGIVFGHSQDVALGHYKAAVLFDPTWAPGHFILGTGQLGDDRVDEAIGHFQRAIELSPGLAYAHGSLGQALLAQGHFREAQAATRRCLELLSERDDARTNLAGQLERCQLLLTLDERLPGILDGQRKPADTAESIAFADLCVLKRQYVSAARLYADRLTPTFGPAEDTIPDFHLRAVRAAILAGSGCGEEGAKLGPAEQARWLEQARAWLRAGLATLTKQLDGGYTVVRNLIMPTLGTWQIEPELVWLRNHDTSSELSPEDRHHFRALWNDVFDLFQRCLGRLSRR